jgi:hypothetical protein
VAGSPETTDVVDQDVQPRVRVEDLGGKTPHLRLGRHVSAKRVDAWIAGGSTDPDAAASRGEGLDR